MLRTCDASPIIPEPSTSSLSLVTTIYTLVFLERKKYFLDEEWNGWRDGGRDMYLEQSKEDRGTPPHTATAPPQKTAFSARAWKGEKGKMRDTTAMITTPAPHRGGEYLELLYGIFLFLLLFSLSLPPPSKRKTHTHQVLQRGDSLAQLSRSMRPQPPLHGSTLPRAPRIRKREKKKERKKTGAKPRYFISGRQDITVGWFGALVDPRVHAPARGQRFELRHLFQRVHRRWSCARGLLLVLMVVVVG